MIFIILPVYNEEREIPKLLERIGSFMKSNSYGFHVFLINDGSTDNSVELANNYTNSMPLTIVDLKQNRGVAEVFRTGFKKVLEIAKDDDIVITMDADNTHDPRIIKMIVAKLNEGYEIVNASPFARGGMLIGLSLPRLICSKVCNALYSILFCIKDVYEYTGFYLGYNVGALRYAYEVFGDELIETDGFTVMAELLIKFRRIPLFITEVQMILRYDLKGEKNQNKNYTYNYGTF